MTDDDIVIPKGRKHDICFAFFCDLLISSFFQPLEKRSVVSLKVGSCITFEFLEEIGPDGQDSNSEGLMFVLRL